ncbi:MAG: hypothetical protein K2X93_05440, partial [Candidatus Obscuribacterales bacterium]|nr:hypothetical protein [Candidatus Obscuribacterales bacterium]
DNSAGDAHSNPDLRPEILPPSAIDLPHRPDDVIKMPVPDNGVVLRGSARTAPSELSSRAVLMDHTPLSRYQGNSLVFYKVFIRNGGSKPILILGKDAQFTAGVTTVKTVAATVLEKHDNTLLRPKEKALVAAVGIGSAGLASSLFYEYMTPEEHRKRDLGLALGRDHGRHEVESENLGTRLVMPGDETHGWVAFEDADSIRRQSTLGVPIMFPPYSTVSATLNVPIEKGTDIAPSPDKPTSGK